MLVLVQTQTLFSSQQPTLRRHNMITPAFSLTATERVLPNLALDFTTAILDPRVTVTRATSSSNPATYVNSSGVITAATNNEPRFDYDPTTLVCKGLLIEESRQNRLTYSQDFSQAVWAVVGTATKTASASVCPDGTTSAYAFSVSTGSNYIWYNLLNITAAARYEPSFYIKRVTTSGTLRINSANGIGNGQWTINLALLGDGFERITRNSPAVTVVTEFTGSGNNFNGTVFVSTAGTLNFEIWGAQIELGTFSTSYIPTTTTSLTRNADQVVMTGTNFSDWYNASEGAISVTLQSLPNAGTSVSRAVCINDGTANNSLISAWVNASTTMRSRLVVGGATQFQFTGAVDPTNKNTICTAYKENDFAASFNGAAALTDATGSLGAPNQLAISGDGTGTTNVYCGHIEKILYWPQRITNAEAQAFAK
jgi:hypothetical protein